MSYFDNHAHTCYSNLRLIDCIIQPKDLINKAIELGLNGIAITDHESLGSHIKVNKIAKKIRETNPDFVIALGNEIYLTETRDKSQKYYHFILIAKDKIGYKGLKELSSKAWLNSYYDHYGYVITAWKAQGGQFNKVLAIEENFPFGKEEHKKFLYTSVTRAAEKLTLVLKN